MTSKLRLAVLTAATLALVGCAHRARIISPSRPNEAAGYTKIAELAYTCGMIEGAFKTAKAQGVEEEYLSQILTLKKNTGCEDLELLLKAAQLLREEQRGK